MRLTRSLTRTPSRVYGHNRRKALLIINGACARVRQYAALDVVCMGAESLIHARELLLEIPVDLERVVDCGQRQERPAQVILHARPAVLWSNLVESVDRVTHALVGK